MSRTEPRSPDTLTRLAAIEATRIRIPAAAAVSPSPSSPHRGTRSREHIVVRVVDSTGESGWGEIPSDSRLPASVLWEALVDGYGPALLSHEWQRPTQVPVAFAGQPRLPLVQAGLDAACWDLWSKRRGVPLAHALGGTRTAITAGSTVKCQSSAEAAVREVNRQVGSGIRRIRLEVEPGRDLDAVRAVHEAYPFLAIQVDAGGRYSESPEDLAALRALDGFGLLAIEEPFGADLAAHSRLRRELRTPLALGSAVDSLEALEEAVAMEAASALNLRVARIGGLTIARRAHDRARDAGWEVWCGSDGEAGIGRATIAALAALPGITLPSEMPGAGARRDKATGIVRPPVQAHDGVVAIPLAQPGIGHEVDTGAVAAMAVTAVTLRP